MPTEAHRRWRNDRGDETHILNYPLNENSIVIELGGYKGLWTKKIIEKYNCNVLVIEPIPEFYNSIEFLFNRGDSSLSNNLILEKAAIGTERKQITLYSSGDASSAYSKVGEKFDVECYPLEFFLEKNKIEKVDLVQINIEGEEYPILEQWIENGSIRKFKFIQVQFHNFIDDCDIKRQKIHQGLISSGFQSRFQYDFVWESWENLNW
jgi:FkbM family methyltransferase